MEIVEDFLGLCEQGVTSGPFEGASRSHVFHFSF